MKRLAVIARFAAGMSLVAVTLVVPGPPPAQSAADQESSGALGAQFQQFLSQYWQEVKQRNSAYLATVHPKLPTDAHEFFFDVTLNMMSHVETTQGIEPRIECQDFNVCKVIYPQPNDSWAAQRFILHDGNWRWLDQ